MIVFILIVHWTMTNFLKVKQLSKFRMPKWFEWFDWPSSSFEYQICTRTDHIRPIDRFMAGWSLTEILSPNIVINLQIYFPAENTVLNLQTSDIALKKKSKGHKNRSIYFKMKLYQKFWFRITCMEWKNSGGGSLNQILFGFLFF